MSEKDVYDSKLFRWPVLLILLGVGLLLVVGSTFVLGAPGGGKKELISLSKDASPNMQSLQTQNPYYVTELSNDLSKWEGNLTINTVNQSVTGQPHIRIWNNASMGFLLKKVNIYGKLKVAENYLIDPNEYWEYNITNASDGWWSGIKVDYNISTPYL